MSGKFIGLIKSCSVRLSALVVLLVGAFALAPLPSAAEQLWVDGTNADKGGDNIKIDLPSFAPAIAKLGESVVNIQTEGSVKVPAGLQFEEGEQVNPFEFFFRQPQQRSDRKFSSLGSGFVIHPDGFIVTNHHVVDKASKILVSFRDDNKPLEAKLIGSDPKTDLALIKVDYPGKLVAAPLGDSDKLEPGDWVIAIGNPFRLGHTATVGIVSAKHRRIPSGSAYNYTNFIQTDASINPGNSGGPLFNANGEVVGVNTAIFSPGRMGQGGFNIGIGFAIPVNLAKGIISQIKDTGKVVRGWLGVLIQPVSEDVAAALQLKEARGALVADVLPDSPAALAGFQRGDVILDFNGTDVDENDDLPMMVADTPIGSKVKVTIVREGRKKELSVTIKELKDEEEKVSEEVVSEESSLGIIVQDLTPEIARALDIEATNGVVVSSVEPDSPAARAQLRRGDIVLEVNSKEVKSPKDFQESIKDTLKEEKPILLLVRRGKTTLFFTIKPDEE